MKTVRFAIVVAEGGAPKIHLAWAAPERDATLRRALKQHRLMTVHQRVRGATKDFAVIGLEPGRDAQFLIFPKSLRRFAGRRIVGVNYSLLSDALSIQPAPAGRRRAAHSRRGKPRVDTGKMVRFSPEPTPEGEPESSAALEEEKPSETDPTDEDPVRGEVRRALQELRSGKPRKAEKRLRALLDGALQPE